MAWQVKCLALRYSLQLYTPERNVMVLYGKVSVNLFSKPISLQSLSILGGRNLRTKHLPNIIALGFNFLYTNFRVY